VAPLTASQSSVAVPVEAVTVRFAGAGLLPVATAGVVLTSLESPPVPEASTAATLY
jgi:hypothetical protein